MITRSTLITLLATVLLLGTACTKKSKFEAPQPSKPTQEQPGQEDDNGEGPAPNTTDTRFDPNASDTNPLQTAKLPESVKKYNPLKQPAHNPVPQVIPVEGVEEHLPLGGKKSITTVTITGATTAVQSQALITERTDLQVSQVALKEGPKTILVSNLYDKLLPENIQKETVKKQVTQRPISSPITLVIYKDQLETISLNHAPTVTRSEYVRSGLAVLEKNSISKDKKILGYVKSGEAHYADENLETALTKEDIAKIVASGACDLSEEYGPCVLVRKDAPISIVIGVLQEGEQSNVYYDNFSDDVQLIPAQNALLSAFNLDSVLYSPKLLNPPVEIPEEPVVAKTEGKKVWGRCSIDADLEIEKISFLLSFESGVGYGTTTCRYNNGVVKSEKIKITLKAFGLGLALDFKEDPFKTVQHVSVKASGLGYTPDVKDMACKYTSIGADATFLGLGLGADTGVIGSNSTLNEDITVTGCKEGTGALAFTFQAIDAEGFQFSVTPIEFKNIYIELVD